MNNIQDKIRGSLFGGAVGDALGYAVEFDSEKSIFLEYGDGGIQSYRLTPRKDGKAIISDDTQMTLFTAAAMLFWKHRLEGRGIAANPCQYAAMTYHDWLITQSVSFEVAHQTVIKKDPDYPNGFISTIFSNVPELFRRRAPGLTCLSGLHTREQQRRDGEVIESFIQSKINNSKGCGGVMRVAPVGMLRWTSAPEKVAMEAAECAAITHCHPLGYMPAAVLAQMVYLLIFDERNLTLREITVEARDTMAKLFAGNEHTETLVNLINMAMELAGNNDTDLNNIHRLGEGWVGDEALAIALYCCLRHQNDFSRCMIAAVNHKGDSDSTGAVAGNILGALVGYDAIEQKWKDDLEISDVLLHTADLLYEADNRD